MAAARVGRSGLDVAVLTAVLATASATPLGPLAAGTALGDRPGSDRLQELDFELPLAGGTPRRPPKCKHSACPPSVTVLGFLSR
jgi:hypothetical protein